MDEKREATALAEKPTPADDRDRELFDAIGKGKRKN